MYLLINCFEMNKYSSFYKIIQQVSLMEAENKRHLDLLGEYLRIVKQLEFWKSENIDCFIGK